jgi:hypothetical protein
MRTAFLLRNVRPFDVTEEKIRGGQRPGTTKAYSTQVGLDGDTTHPILAMASVTSTYIIPVVAPAE